MFKLVIQNCILHDYANIKIYYTYIYKNNNQNTCAHKAYYVFL